MRLTAHLLSRLLLTGIIVLMVSISWLMHAHHEQANQEIEAASVSMLRILELQSIGFRQGIGLEPRFPDWYPVTQVSLPNGACIKLLDSEKRAIHTTCRGKVASKRQVPAWFNWLYRTVFGADSALVRKFEARDAIHYLEIMPDADIEVAIVWERTQLAIILTCAVVLILSAITAWSIHHAIKPVEAIVEAIGRLGDGGLDTRLGNYRFRELNSIASAFDTLADSLHEEKAKQNALIQRIQTIQEEERRMIALELHDEFGQYLSAINANATALASADNLDTVHADAKRIQLGAQRLVSLVHELLHRLRPYPNSDLNVVEMVESLIAETRADNPGALNISLVSNGIFDPVSTDVATAAYRICQEALTNVQRHADASKVNVAISCDGEALSISVTDDGKTRHKDAIKSGFGITGMRDRAIGCGGHLEVKSNPEHGLRISAFLPLSKEPA